MSLMIVLLPFSSYIASLPFIQQEWEMSNAQAALVFSSYLVGYALSSLILVPYTDRLPAGRVLLASIVVIAVSNVLFPLLAQDMWTGSLLRAVAGAGHVGAYIPGIQLVSRKFEGSRRGSAVGIFVAAGYAGTTISYVFMGQLLNVTESWRTAYLITAIVGLLGIVLAVFLTRIDGAKSAETAKPEGKASGRLNVGILKERSMALIILVYALHTAELYLARLWLPLLLGATLVQSGWEPLEATALATTLAGFMFMTGIAAVIVGGTFSDYLGRTLGGGLIFSLSGACSFIVGWLVGVPPSFLIALGFVYGFVTAADSAIYSTAITELSPRGLIGSTQAVQSFIGFTIGAAATIAAGWILDLVDTPAAWGLAFSFNGLLAVVGVLSLVWLRRMPQAAQMADGKR